MVAKERELELLDEQFELVRDFACPPKPISLPDYRQQKYQMEISPRDSANIPQEFTTRHLVSSTSPDSSDLTNVNVEETAIVIETSTSALPPLERFAHYERLAQEAEVAFSTNNRNAWLVKLDTKLLGTSDNGGNESKDDLWSLLDWILASSELAEQEVSTKQRIDRVLATLGRLSVYWYFRIEKLDKDETTIGRALKYLDRALERPNQEKWARGIALFGAGLLYRATGDLYTADKRLDEGENLLREGLGKLDPSKNNEIRSRIQLYLAFTLTFRGLIVRDRPDNSAAAKYIDEALGMFRGDLRSRWGEALALTYRGTIALSQIIRKIKESEEKRKLHKGGTNLITRLERAITDLEESERLFQEIGDPWGYNQVLIYLAISRYQIDRCNEAVDAANDDKAKRRYYEEARRLFVRFLERYRGGNPSTYNLRGIARSLCGLAAVAQKQGHPIRAMHLLGAAKAVRMDYLHSDRIHRDISEYLETARRASDVIGDKATALDALNAGSMMVHVIPLETSIDKVIAYAIRPNLEIVHIDVYAHHSGSQELCEYCGGPAEETSRPHESWGNQIIVRTEKLAGYRCKDCGSEWLDSSAVAEFLKKALGIIEPTNDASTARVLRRELLVALS
jgi:tetratricopeptide (TPR) repeat protein